MNVNIYSKNSFEAFPKRKISKDNQKPLKIAILKTSDTGLIFECASGLYVKRAFEERGHFVCYFTELKNDEELIKEKIHSWCQSDLDVIITLGGTGFTQRDTTYEAVSQVIKRQIPGFGELFRALSYKELDLEENSIKVWVACGSRAIAGVCDKTAIFALPGSPHAAKLACDKIILDLVPTLILRLNE